MPAFSMASRAAPSAISMTLTSAAARWRVTIPVCLPSIIDIARYYFVNAMTTISAVVFLYSPKTMLASISIVHLDEAGNVGSAAAMATLIVATSGAITLLSFAAEALLVRRTQRWRAPAAR